MGEGVCFGRYIVFYAILLYYVAFCSVSTIHFLIPFTLRLMHIGWLIFIDKRWNVLAVLLCLAAFVRYTFFKSNKAYSAEFEDDLVDLPFQSSFMTFELPSHPPLSPPSSLLSPPSSPPSYFTSSARSSCSPSWSSLQSSPRSSFSSPMSSPPPPPPPVKIRKRDYVRMASNASLSSEDSGDSDIDIKAEMFIAHFKTRLMFENERLHECASKPCDPITSNY
ncbi:unnamed protein product [Eruca vesicaria subsp. sativa]|uniref:Uncharacterized protein n=1 Tax=Eruca vesicaria subsp. sativa TaxID=29727 RepID=A0ABC8JZ50_ERUVS|nr:unnamed protein product [Eruca vesicaria subsp. sativa]